jgi:hypothetical protein
LAWYLVCASARAGTEPHTKILTIGATAAW